MTFAEEVRRSRNEKDDYFRVAEAPLTPAQRAMFAGLAYYDPDPSLRFEVTLEASEDDHRREEVEMSDGSTDELERAGLVRVRIDGSDVSLLAYRQGHDLFIPFRDATSGGETYGAGRYVEARPIAHDRWLLDFNYAYNPYCAYNDGWRCPLPPRENWLRVPIRAGEKTFTR
jgi:uncharacterized protein (DUF1684 family)